MTHPSPPPKLPPFIFLLSDHTTIELACDVAAKLQSLDEAIVAWDFLEPVHEAVSAFVDVDFGADLGDPRKHTHGDVIKDLATWTDNHFGLHYIGTRAFDEAKGWAEFDTGGTIVFRDATWTHIEPFLKEFKLHEILIADFTPGPCTLHGTLPASIYAPFANRHLIHIQPTVDNMLAAILEASR